MIVGKVLDMLTLEAQTLLIGRGEYFYEEQFTYIHLYEFEGKPYLIPIFSMTRSFLSSSIDDIINGWLL
jgi:hypothetical protein